MAFRIVEKDFASVGKDDDGRCFVTDDVDEFHVDRVGAQRLCDLLNHEAKPLRISRTVTK